MPKVAMKPDTRRKANLHKLGKFLVELGRPEPWYKRLYYRFRPLRRKTFCMSLYSSQPFRNTVDTVHCGTSACAVGWGPTAGIKDNNSVGWLEYCAENFLDLESREWQWCFSAGWKWADNSARGAGLRILHYVYFGVPEWFELPTSMSVSGRLKGNLKNYERAKQMAWYASTGAPCPSIYAGEPYPGESNDV